VISIAGCLIAGCAGSTVGSGAVGDAHRAMRFVAGGTFLMGEAQIAEPMHTVTLSPFYMDTAPVTQKEYLALMNVNPSHFAGDPGLPVETETWFDAVLFCNARSRTEGLDTVYSFTAVAGMPGNDCDSLEDLSISYDKNGFRLPTEAEYEYAYRAGTTTDYYWGDTVDGRYCWYYANSDSTTHPVCRKRPNAFGLYDMAGNLWEWCNDWWAGYGAGAQTDPTGPTAGVYRVVRGGCWYIYYLPVLSAGFRSYAFPSPGTFQPPHDFYGFRCVLKKT
jgi:formylglycine-generating enzyme required for sulfatase activity